VKPKTEEFLYFLLWTADRLSRPTFRNVTDSFEAWAYRNGLMRQLAGLDRRKFLETQQSGSNQRLYRLTEQGRLRAVGGRDPEHHWSRPWNGQWRFVLFDVSTSHNKQRRHLRLYLKDRDFGCLQRSVWISPDPLLPEKQLLGQASVDVNSLLLLEGRPSAGETDSDIVSGAWDFQTINLHYSRYLQVLERFPAEAIRDKSTARSLQQWGQEERLAWQTAAGLDPFLPEKLLPQNYLGRKAWAKRVKTLHEAGRQIRDLTL
jgi:phenylacetic acid degradation operon negative regulatory protein